MLFSYVYHCHSLEKLLKELFVFFWAMLIVMNIFLNLCNLTFGCDEGCTYKRTE